MACAARPLIANLSGRNPLRLAAILSAILCVLAGAPGAASAGERIRIASDWGNLTATLADNAAGRALARMLPLTLETHDHLRQEKVGTLPNPLPEIARQRGFQPGTLGIWRSDRFVIYYVRGEVPGPGIMVVGQVEGSTAIFDRPGPVTVRIERAD